METQSDFKDLLALFNAHHVDYMIVGGYALAFHGAPRFTGDIDLFIKCDAENAGKVVRALGDFGFGSLDLTTTDFERPDVVVQLGVPPVRIDIITSLTGLSWSAAVADRIADEYGEVPVFFISRDSLVINKRATGRMKDLADLESLGEL